MKMKELNNLSREELLGKRKTLREELFKLTLARHSGRVEKPHLFKIVRKDIARIETLLSQEAKKKEE